MHFDALSCLLINLQLLLLAGFLFFLIVVRKQINQLFVVELKETGADQILFGVGGAFDCVKNIMDSSRHYTFQILPLLVSLHSVRLTSACLTIREYGPIVSLQHALNNGQGCILEN